MTQLEEQTIRLKEQANKSKKEHSSINEELLRTKQQLEINQSQLSDAHSELDIIKGELLSQKQVVESFQQEAGLRLDARLKEQQSNLEEEFQLSLAKLQEEKGKIESELRNEIEQVSSEKRNFEVCTYVHVYTAIATMNVLFMYYNKYTDKCITHTHTTRMHAHIYKHVHFMLHYVGCPLNHSIAVGVLSSSTHISCSLQRAPTMHCWQSHTPSVYTFTLRALNIKGFKYSIAA